MLETWIWNTSISTGDERGKKGGKERASDWSRGSNRLVCSPKQSLGQGNQALAFCPIACLAQASDCSQCNLDSVPFVFKAVTWFLIGLRTMEMPLMLSESSCKA